MHQIHLILLYDCMVRKLKKTSVRGNGKRSLHFGVMLFQILELLEVFSTCLVLLRLFVVSTWKNHLILFPSESMNEDI